MKALICYYRVSTRRQGQSGLGLDAQRAAAAAYAASVRGRIVAEYTETESGKRSDRPQLAAAVARTRAARGTLVVAKLDRLARNVAFTSALMEAGVDFVCCDNPTANRLTVHILAAVAEDEARRISERTKAALAAAKRRGIKLGTHRRGHRIDWRKGQRNGLATATRIAAEQRNANREAAYAHIVDRITAWRNAGASYAAIASRLNDDGEYTVGNGKWHATTVQRLLAS